MDYVSGTSDAALNSSSASDVSSHQIQMQREGFSPSDEQRGLKNQFCLIHQARGPAARPRAGAWRRCPQGQLTPARPGAAAGPTAAASAAQTPLEGSPLPTFPSPSLQYFQPPQPPRRLLRAVGGGRRLQLCDSPAQDQPPSPQPPPSWFSPHTSGIKDKL